MDTTILRWTAEACVNFLSAQLAADWTARVAALDMTVAEVVAHIGNCLAWYAHDLAAGPAPLSTMTIEVKADSPARDLLATLTAGTTMLRAVIDSAGKSDRG